MYGRRWRQRQGVDIAERFRLPYNAERRAPSAERRAPSAERRAPSAERRARAPSAERRAPSAERRAPSAERRAPSAERRAPSAERRAPVCSGRVLAAALLALSGALALFVTAAHAQSASTLVSNINVGTNGSNSIGGNSNDQTAQKFNVPSGDQTYLLTAVAVHVRTSVSGGSGFLATVHAVDGDNPGDVLYTLSGPGNPGNGNKTYTAPENAILESGTSYFVVFSKSGSRITDLQQTTTNSQSGFTGWTIDNSSRSRDNSSNWSDDDPLKIKVSGYRLLDDTPMNLTARAVAPMQVTLEWDRTLPALKTIDRDDGYRIEWSPDGSTSWTSLVNYTNQNVTDSDIWCTCYPTKFNDDTIEPGETRYYRIQAVDNDDVSLWSNVVSATTPGLVDSDAGLIEFGAVVSELDALNDQKVFRIDLKSGKYRFTISGAAPKHRVVVTDAGGTEIENFVLESNNNLVPRITAQSTGQHQVKVSHGGGFGNAGSGSPQAGSFQFQLVPVSEDAAATLRLPSTPSLSPILNTYGDLDSWAVAVQPGQAYAVRVWGRETNRGTAATPRIKRARPPSTTHVYDMGKPWVDGVTHCQAVAHLS